MMTIATHPSLARETAIEVASSAKWYGLGALAGLVGGGLFALYDYTPPAPPPPPVPFVAPAAVQPPPAIRPRQSEGGDADLVASARTPTVAAARHDPMHCVEQVTASGQMLGTLCQPDPGGVAGSAMGANNRPAAMPSGAVGASYR